MDREKKKRLIKSIKYGGAIWFLFVLLGCMYAEHSVGELCQYNVLLGPTFTFREITYYIPGSYFYWMLSPEISSIIPDVLNKYIKFIKSGVFLGGFSCGLCIYYMNKKNVSLADAKWATSEDIEQMGLGKYNHKYTKVPLLDMPLLRNIKVKKDKKTVKKTGVVLGLNPYTKKLMLHDGPEHILLMAPTRSGKGVSTIVPTGCIWSYSIFFFDPKGELWQLTSKYRQQVLGQKVLKFEPLCVDGSSARWNPLAEINFRTFAEFKDVQSIVNILVKPDGESNGKDPFWDDAATELLTCCILHLMYAHEREGLNIPCLTDMMSLLSPPDKDIDELFDEIKKYPHITEEEFFSDKNPFEMIYGERYIKNLNQFNKLWRLPDDQKIRSLKDLKKELKKRYLDRNEKVPWDKDPYWICLVHPRVAEGAANMVNLNETTRASLIKSTQTKLSLYQNPIVQRNTEVSDFCVRDLLADPNQAVSLYLVMQSDDIDTVKPLSRLLISFLLAKNTRDMHVNSSGVKQRVLLMLDEFPQLGGMNKIETNMAICAGYGIKYCIVCQDVNQLNKAYTENNSIATNCHIHEYFTPNVDPGGKTAKAISETLGKFEFQSESKSTGSGGWFGGSSTYSMSTRDLMTPDEVARLPRDSEIIFMAGQYPIKGKKIEYWNEDSLCNTFFTSKTKMGYPVFSDTVTEIHNFKQLHDYHAAEIRYMEECIEAVAAAKAEAAKKLGGKIKDLDERERKKMGMSKKPVADIPVGKDVSGKFPKAAEAGENNNAAPAEPADTNAFFDNLLKGENSHRG
ncbi:type IV secretory system conjugative DNA transfer family protein [Anaerovibrio sp.]|uniref:type IV secretory system conjugative DNA transfer family protein n=1 Tax=Anaerovibrio sp. TaxID=1872532 RepID=UPI00388D746F